MTQSKLRIVFAGTPEFASGHLQSLIDTGIQPVAVYTQPDRPKGRGRKAQPSPVKMLAQANHIPVFQPQSLKDPSAQASLKNLAPDLMIVVAYGLLLPQAVLDIPLFGCMNVHASLLPHWRGAAPIHRAIEAGNSESGITLMQMDAGLDTGPMLFKQSCSIHPQETTASLHDKLLGLGQQLLPSIVHLLEQQQKAFVGEEQDDRMASYAHKINKQEGQINFHQPAHVIDRQIRAFAQVPGCAILDHTGERLKIIQAELFDRCKTCETAKAGEIIQVDLSGIYIQCNPGVIKLTTLQYSGSKPLPVQALLNGKQQQLSPGKIFQALSN